MQKIAKLFNRNDTKVKISIPETKGGRLINTSHKVCHKKIGGFNIVETYEDENKKTYVVVTINCIKCIRLSDKLSSDKLASYKLASYKPSSPRSEQTNLIYGYRSPSQSLHRHVRRNSSDSPKNALLYQRCNVPTHKQYSRSPTLFTYRQRATHSPESFRLENCET